MKHSGSCLCKSVKFSFFSEYKHFDACHCSICRKWGGGPVFTVNAQGDSVFEGEEFITLFESSTWAERGFCSKCGTHLFYRLKDKSFCNFNLGIIDGHEEYEFTVQIYTDAKPHNYDFANKTKMMTEQDVIDAFSKT